MKKKSKNTINGSLKLGKQVMDRLLDECNGLYLIADFGTAKSKNRGLRLTLWNSKRNQKLPDRHIILKKITEGDMGKIKNGQWQHFGIVYDSKNGWTINYT